MIPILCQPFIQGILHYFCDQMQIGNVLAVQCAFSKACFPLQEGFLSKRISLDCFLLANGDINSLFDVMTLAQCSFLRAINEVSIDIVTETHILAILFFKLMTNII
ncbi:hypothetical protein ACJX0J_033477 [Zea mays]